MRKLRLGEVDPLAQVTQPVSRIPANWLALTKPPRSNVLEADLRNGGGGDSNSEGTLPQVCQVILESIYPGAQPAKRESPRGL